MKSLFPAAVLVVLAASPAAAQMPPARPAAHLDVTGRGSIERAPDRVVVSFSIVTNDDVAARATSANNTAYNALLAKLRALGIADAAIRTNAYAIAFNPRPPAPNPQFQTRYGYVVTRSVSVTSDRTDQAGPIIDNGVAAGVTDVGGVSFTLRDNRDAVRAALAAAMADAQAQAAALADAGHVRIVRILAISTGSPPVVPAPRMALAAAGGAVPTEIPAGNLTVTANVAVSYEVAP